MMMTKFLFILLAFSINGVALAQDGSEDAMIVNQELEYLQTVAKKISDSGTNQRDSAPVVRELPGTGTSLEERYFGDESESDSLRTRSAAPKRPMKVRGY